MYTIIGGDGKEYGPVTADQIRTWISAGRANLETRAKAQGTDEWKQLGDFPEFSAGGAGVPPIFSRATGAPESYPTAAGAGRMALEMTACYERGWALLKANFWPFVGITLFVLILPSCLGVVVRAMTGTANVGDLHVQPGDAAALFSSPAFPLFLKNFGLSLAEGLLFSYPLGIGFYYYILKRSRGQSAFLRDVFAGFSRAYLPLIAAAILTTVLITLGFFVFILPGIYLAVAYSLTPLLIIDRKVGVWTAMEMSRRAITSRWWTMLGIFLIGLLLMLAGFMALLVGLLVAVPLFYCAMIYAYLDLFPDPSAPAAPEPAETP